MNKIPSLEEMLKLYTKKDLWERIQQHIQTIDQLKQQLAEKDKEIECWKDKTKNKILNMKTTDFVKMCLSCGIMVDIKQTQTQLAIQELEKVKNFICDYSEITGQAWNHTLRFLNNKIKELKGEKDE